jgi:anti-sigma regulatory factor (Ser/Thr protein kinase)
MSVTADDIEVQVSDDGPGAPDLDALGGALPPVDQDGGRGLFLVRAVSRDVTTMSTAEGSLVRCVVPRVSAAAPAPSPSRTTS